jgi:SAM-dependent methyltransferase
MNSQERHLNELQANLTHWNSKPLLRKIYRHFYRLIAEQLSPTSDGLCVELGSGIANIKEVIPDCLQTDFCESPWVDQVENAYCLSFKDSTVANVIMFDVFHHLRYPGAALKECHRVLTPGGRVILFEPCLSALGALIYGLAHHEPIAIRDTIEWNAPPGWDGKDQQYYAAQGNATRIFFGRSHDEFTRHWKIITRRRLAALSYVLSGGYSKPQLYPEKFYPFLTQVDRVCDYFPLIFATRLLVVLEKRVQT